MTDHEMRIRKFTLIITAYPVVLIAISLIANLFIFDIVRPVIALPAQEIVRAMVIASILLVINHSWLMTSTELTRLRYRMYATPEEWADNGRRKDEVAEQGWTELERHHNAHRNATENTVYFASLAAVLAIVSPPILLAEIWLIGFAIARLGYTFGALRPMAGIRQLSMSLSLLALYGISSYLALSLLV